MARRRILKEGSEALTKVSRPVDILSKRTIQLIEDLLDTLDAVGNGAGLAAPQVGILKRVAVVITEDGRFELINPEIVSSNGIQIGPEGCLSCPGEYGIVERADKVRVKSLDREGNTVFYEAKGFTSRAFQHEIDHLDGVMFKEKASRMLDEDEME